MNECYRRLLLPIPSWFLWRSPTDSIPVFTQQMHALCRRFFPWLLYRRCRDLCMHLHGSPTKDLPIGEPVDICWRFLHGCCPGVSNGWLSTTKGNLRENKIRDPQRLHENKRKRTAVGISYSLNLSLSWTPSPCQAFDLPDGLHLAWKMCSWDTNSLPKLPNKEWKARQSCDIPFQSLADPIYRPALQIAAVSLPSGSTDVKEPRRKEPLRDS